MNMNSLNNVLRLKMYCVTCNVIHIRIFIKNKAVNIGIY